MSTLQHLLEVAVEGPATDGSVAHRRALHSWYTEPAANGKPAQGAKTVVVGACGTYPADAPPPSTWFAYSGGWALSRGAVPCLDDKCFPGGAA